MIHLHLEVEYLRLCVAIALGSWDEVLMKQIEHFLANLTQFIFDLFAVFLYQIRVLMFIDVQRAPRCTACTNHVLICNTQQVPLLERMHGK